MHKLVVISDDSERVKGLNDALSSKGFSCFTNDSFDNGATTKEADLVILDMTRSSNSELDDREREQIGRMKRGRILPIIALIDREMIEGLGSYQFIDDFVVEPWALPELAIRIQRVLKKTKSGHFEDVTRRGDLTIDTSQCVVTQSGEPINLTFTEYELLKLMMLNKGKVYSRENLLNAVWGYNYFGGERTVDVHIRRLRSKIEDADHTYIETVRNLGYRFDDLGNK